MPVRQTVALLTSLGTIMPKVTSIDLPIAEIWRFLDVQNGSCAPPWIMKNSKF